VFASATRGLTLAPSVSASSDPASLGALVSQASGARRPTVIPGAFKGVGAALGARTG
jgi:hypothetical protein